MMPLLCECCPSIIRLNRATDLGLAVLEEQDCELPLD